MAGKNSLIHGQGRVVIYPAPGDLATVEGLWSSADFTARVDHQDVFVYGTDMHWSFFNYAADIPATIEVVFNADIDTYQVRPASYGIDVQQSGRTLTFSLPPDQHVVVQVNDTYKLLVSSDPLEIDPPDGPADDVIYFGPGVHWVGENYAPAGLKDGDTIYIAGGAVVEGLFNISHTRNLSIRGRGVIAMGEWKWIDPARRSGMVLRPECDGLFIEGITLVKAPGWQLSVGDSDAAIQHIKLLGVGNWYNSDGVQTWGDNHGTTLTDSFIFARDDALNINNGTHNFTASRLVLWNDDNGASFMLGWGGSSDSSDILIEDSIVLENSSRYTGVFSARWGAAEAHTVKDVIFRNIIIENANTFVDMLIGPSDWNDGSAGTIENVSFLNIQTPHTSGLMLGNSAENSIRDVRFAHLVQASSVVTDVEELGFLDINVVDLTITAE